MRKPFLGHILGGALLVCGTSVGAGMLALPVVTSEGGFWPSIFIFILCYLFMTATGLLLMEVALKMPKDANIISMADRYLGNWGKVGAWILYLFLFYLLNTAYISGVGGLLEESTNSYLNIYVASILFTLVFAWIVNMGAKFVDRINFLLMFGLIITYFLFVTYGVPSIDLAKLKYNDLPKAFLALPVIFTSFSYQGIIPSLTYYMEKDVKRIRKAIILGTTITFSIYFVWQFLILGIVPIEGVQGLLEAKIQGKTAVFPLKGITNIPQIYSIGQAFAFFAITTSFLGVSLGLFDFIADGLSLKKKGSKKVIISLLTFGPPLLIALTKPGLFLIALGYAGGIGCALLLGLFPVLMVFSLRYKHKEIISTQIIGNKKILFVLFLFVVFELIIELIGEYLRFFN